MDNDPTRLRELFESLVALRPEERPAWLGANCPDPALRAVLERMAAADETREPRVLDRPIDELAARMGDPEAELPAPAAGTSIGPFTLMEVLGRGGSSVVYRAIREQEGVQQSVALKLLRVGLHTEEERRRFRSERRVLAQLSHPNIATLIEGGITEAGVPYIALELVEGRPVTVYASEHRLDLRRRLALFLAVCRAVEAAHRALVVHRDLKPSNVLVTRDGHVKLLDFGIAKLLDAESDEGAAEYRAMTPAYAAPEQFSGQRITTATDVYALGVLLGELVTGTRHAEGSDPTPSARLSEDGASDVMPGTVRALRRELRGDIDHIVRKAMDGDPERRYASAGSLADDIERYLAGRPVEAHPTSRWYRARKFVQRHRGGAVITLVLAVAVLASLAIALRQAELARREAQRANTVRDFLQSLFEPVAEGIAEDRQPTVKELVATGVQRLQADTALGVAERVDLTLMFARLNDNLGELPAARPLADAANALAASELPELHPLAIEALTVKGNLALRADDYDVAEPALREAERRLQRAGVAGQPLVGVLSNLSVIHSRRGERDAAVELERRGLDERIREHGPDAEETAGGYNNYGVALEAAGRFAEAAAALRRAYELDTRYRDPRSYDVMFGLSNLGATLGRAGELRQARDLLRQAGETLAALGGKPRYLHVLNAQKLCSVEAMLDAPAAQAACAEAARLTESFEGASSETHADTFRMEAARLLEAGELARAGVALDRSWELYPDIAENSMRRGGVVRMRAELAWYQGQLEKARTLALQARPMLAPLRDRYITTGFDAFLLLVCESAPDPACPPDLEEVLRTALAGTADYRHPRMLLPKLALARVELRRGDAKAARELLEPAIEQARAELGDSHPMIHAARLWLVAALDTAGDCETARRVREGLAAAPPDPGWRHPLLMEARAQAPPMRCPARA